MHSARMLRSPAFRDAGVIAPPQRWREMSGRERRRWREREGEEKWISEMGLARTSLETEKESVEGEEEESECVFTWREDDVGEGEDCGEIGSQYCTLQKK